MHSHCWAAWCGDADCNSISYTGHMHAQHQFQSTPNHAILILCTLPFFFVLYCKRCSKHTTAVKEWVPFRILKSAINTTDIAIVHTHTHTPNSFTTLSITMRSMFPYIEIHFKHMFWPYLQCEQFFFLHELASRRSISPGYSSSWSIEPERVCVCMQLQCTSFVQPRTHSAF